MDLFTGPEGHRLAHLRGEKVICPPLTADADCLPTPLASKECFNIVKDLAFDFVLQIMGDSMINAFIPRQTHLLVERTAIAQNGDIIIAAVNGRVLVRFFKKNDYKQWLVPANIKYPEIEITPGTHFEIRGVVRHIINTTENLRQYMR